MLDFLQIFSWIEEQKLEEEFGVSIPEDSEVAIQTVGDAIRYIMEHGETQFLRFPTDSSEHASRRRGTCCCTEAIIG
ncbi:hypothetical protein SH449x_004052 [Pirellulaceae bacterium SH449]